jgi:hypothetical protein
LFFFIICLGLTVGGVKYMVINSEFGKVLRGKKAESSVAISLSKKAIVVAVGKGAPQDISNRAEKMSGDLASKGF